MTPTHPDPTSAPTEAPAKPGYQPPTVVTYTSQEILEHVGPALACSINDAGIG